MHPKARTQDEADANSAIKSTNAKLRKLEKQLIKLIFPMEDKQLRDYVVALGKKNGIPDAFLLGNLIFAQICTK